MKRYVDEDGTDLVMDAMAGDQEWCASALALVEAQVTLCQLGLDDAPRATLMAALREDWERFLVVPVDDVCLGRATEIGCDHRVHSLDAIHLAAADRLPRPLRFLTFDRRQAQAAAALRLE